MAKIELQHGTIIFSCQVKVSLVNMLKETLKGLN